MNKEKQLEKLREQLYAEEEADYLDKKKISELKKRIIELENE